MGVYDETVITIVHSELTLEALHASKAAHETVCARHPGCVSLTLVQAGIKLPDAAMRTAVSEVLVQTKSRTRCAARVFFGDGFWLTTVRGVLTAIEVLRPLDFPRRTFSALQPATLWLTQSIRETPPWALRLSAAVHMLGDRTAKTRSPAQ